MAGHSYLHKLCSFLLILWLSATTACGRTTSLVYTIEGRAQRIEQATQPVAPPEARPVLSQTERVVLDMSTRCREPDDRLRARCRRIAKELSEAITQTGREVILSNDSHESALLLAKERAAEIVLSVDVSAQRLRPSKHKSSAHLETERTERVDRADLLCQPALRTALYHQNTHILAPLQAEITDAQSRAVLFSYEDVLEAEIGMPEETVTASVGPSHSPSSNDDGDDDIALSVGHRHDHHCHHDHGSTSDNDEAALFAAVVLTVLVVGIIVLAASAASEKGESRCILSDVPEPSLHAKRALSEELDRLLTTRLARALFDEQGPRQN